MFSSVMCTLPSSAHKLPGGSLLLQRAVLCRARPEESVSKTFSNWPQCVFDAPFSVCHRFFPAAWQPARAAWFSDHAPKFFAAGQAAFRMLCAALFMAVYFL